MKRLVALILSGLPAAPLFGLEVAPIRVAAPVGGYTARAAMAGTRLQSAPSLTPGLGSAAAPQISPSLAPPALTPSVIPSALAPQVYAQPTAGSFAAPAPAAPAAAIAPQASPAGPALSAPVSASVLQKAFDQRGVSPAAVESLKGLAARLEASRLSGTDFSGSLSGRFFDQAGNRGPPVSAEASAPAAPSLPAGVKSVSVETVRTAEDVERLIPGGVNSDGLRNELASEVSRMAPYDIYTYQDSRGGSFTGIDISRPGTVDLIPELQSHEVRLIKKLMLVDSNIRVLVREDGKTPDLVMGDKLVELKSFSGQTLPLESLISKANRQISEHGRRHGLGHGAAAVDMTRESAVPTARVQGILNSWQAGEDKVVLDQVIVFGGKDMKVFVRQADGRYQARDPKAAIARVVAERPVSAQDAQTVKQLLRKGRLSAANWHLRRQGHIPAGAAYSVFADR